MGPSSNPRHNLYQIQDADGTGYVEAASMGEAVTVWRDFLRLENDTDTIPDDYEPDGVICLETGGTFVTRDRVEALKLIVAAEVDRSMRESMVGTGD